MAPRPSNIRTKIQQTSSTLWLGLDPGNTDVKAMLRQAYGHEIVFPHAVRMPTPSEYNATESAYFNTPARLKDSAIFKMDGTGYIVGSLAQQSGMSNRLLGAEKYRREHLGALLTGTLLQLAPEGHNNVKLVVAHPSKLSNSNRKALYEAVTGKFSVRRAGDKSDTLYKITEVFMVEEPTCDFQTFVLTQKGTTLQRPQFALSPGMEILIVNVGGWISHMVPVVVTSDGGLEINVAAAEPINTGILNVMSAFEAEIKEYMPDIIGRIQTLPTQLVANALMTDVIQIKNTRHDCTRQVENAMGVLINALREPYYAKFGRGIQFNAIVVGGGGGGMSMDHLTTNLFDHGYIYAAEEDVDRMRYSVVRGAMKGLEAYFLGQNGDQN